MNRLADETSPYLQQHKDNPVDWYPWGDEAFERARAEDKPVLLSVGYAACHWCHVMAHESFEDPSTAAVMNELFVNVKVDREERPDVDAIYMEAVQANSGHGGWPMTVFLTPDGRPFFGGTYYPRTARPGLPSFTEVCQAMAAVWQDRRDDVLDQAGQLTAALGRAAELVPSAGPLAGADAIAAARDALHQRFDEAWGGFGPPPKFPQPDQLEMLLRAWRRDQCPDTLLMVTVTLDAMASGGMYDHLGGGFARYSVDREWLVPHFEKMLTDQALLARVYLQAWQVTGEDRYLQVLTETIDYVRRDLRDAGGGFFSSEDADSEGVEGKFYVWQQAEIESLLAPELAAAAVEWWGVTAGGNFEGANILHRPVRGDLARPPAVEEARQILFEAREKRVRPGLDDKVLTEWNGLFLGALADAAAATGRADWLDDARAGAEFLLGNLRRDDGRWLRGWQGGRPGRHLAYAGDYAAVVDAFTRLAEATGEARWIGEARSAADAMLELFWDDKAGGLFTNGSDAETLITRNKDLVDNAVPSANGAAAVALLRLGALVGEGYYTQRAEDIVRLLTPLVAQHPAAFTRLLAAVDMIADGVTEIAVVGDRRDLVGAVRSRWLPNAVLAWGEPYPSPLFESRSDGLAYVCRNYACQAPVADPDALLAQLVS
ncbi:MAG TPA: thioredoxin domain-containing protein [Acidimicrobiales bacterium]|nr:thioredoxin domain-containing protein [Acidimicrobiales bacterium]